MPSWILLSGACPVVTGAGGLECETPEGGWWGVGCRLVGWPVQGILEGRSLSLGIGWPSQGEPPYGLQNCRSQSVRNTDDKIA